MADPDGLGWRWPYILKPETTAIEVDGEGLGPPSQALLTLLVRDSAPRRDRNKKQILQTQTNTLKDDFISPKYHNVLAT